MQEEIVTTNNKMIELNNYGSVPIVKDTKSLRVTVNEILRILQDKPVIYLNLTNTYNSFVPNEKCLFKIIEKKESGIMLR